MGGVGESCGLALWWDFGLEVVLDLGIILGLDLDLGIDLEFEGKR